MSKNCVLLEFCGETPVFVQICSIVFLPGILHPFLVGELLQTISYCEHFHAYEVAVMPQPTVRVFVLSDLVDHRVLSFVSASE